MPNPYPHKPNGQFGFKPKAGGGSPVTGLVIAAASLILPAVIKVASKAIKK